jgi:tRNA pseudouridine38-40 synthase
MRTLKLTIQYDGTSYVGWQRQAAGVSIQGLLEAALRPVEGTDTAVHGAGRTDAGVHALAQVASVSLSSGLPEGTIVRALNAALPPDVRVLAAEEVSPAFHARFSARTKTYEYRIVNAPLVSPFLYRYAWHVRRALDMEAMQAAAFSFAGRHDFAAFQGAGSTAATTERTILDLAWAAGHGFDQPLVFRVTGDGFLRHMVRSIVGTLVEVGSGRLKPGRVPAILQSRDRTQAGPTAPPHGLFLTGVQY